MLLAPIKRSLLLAAFTKRKPSLGLQISRPSSTMDFKNYHALGFDLDYTFVQYKNDNVTQLLHETMTKILINHIPNFPENEKERFTAKLSDEELRAISYKGLIYDAMESCYSVVQITESHEENNYIPSNASRSGSAVPQAQILNGHRASKYVDVNALDFQSSEGQNELATRTSSSESNSSGHSSSSESTSMSEDFEIPASTTCKVVRIFRGLDDWTEDREEILKVYKHDCDFMFFKRLVNRSTICKNWHPKEKMMFTVIENNFEFGCFAAHMKLLGLYNRGAFADAGYKMRDLTTYFCQSIELAFGNYESLYYKRLYENPQDYLIKNDETTLQRLKELRSEDAASEASAEHACRYLFLATNSPPQYSKFLLNYCVGPEWYQIFDLILFRCKKPNFFRLSNPFQALNKESFSQINITNSLNLRTNLTMNEGFYSGGSYKPVNEVFNRNLKTSECRVLYFGDSIVSDVAANYWDACYVQTSLETPEWAEKLVKSSCIHEDDSSNNNNNNEDENNKIRRYHLIDYVKKYYANKTVRTIDDVRE